MKEADKIGKKVRESNIELFRIVSMFMILGVHIDGASLGLPELNGNPGAATARDSWQLIVEALCITGVNCFTLISGYFGIRLRLQNVVTYLFQCAFYAVGIYTVVGLMRPELFSWKGWGDSWLILTHTDLWYVPAYFCLMLLAPFINAGFETLKRKTSLIITLVFVAYNFWAGWWWGGKFNPTGYTVVQLVMMYMIGRCISGYSDVIKSRSFVSRVSVAMCGYIVLSLLTALYACWNPAKAYAYNSPIVVAASVAALLFFASLKFKSAPVNYIAKSAFAVYLLHKAPLVWICYMKPQIAGLWHHSGLVEFTVMAIVISVGIYLFAMVCDAVRRFVSKLLFV